MSDDCISLHVLYFEHVQDEQPKAMLRYLAAGHNLAGVASFDTNGDLHHTDFSYLGLR